MDLHVSHCSVLICNQTDRRIKDSGSADGNESLDAFRASAERAIGAITCPESGPMLNELQAQTASASIAALTGRPAADFGRHKASIVNVRPSVSFHHLQFHDARGWPTPNNFKCSTSMAHTPNADGMQFHCHYGRRMTTK